MKTYKYVVVNEKGYIKILTPDPYTLKNYVNLFEESKTDTKKHEQFIDLLNDLNESCKFLYNCLKVLGISKETAHRRDYTLNYSTGEKLYSLAINNDNVSREFAKIIKNYNW